MIIEGTLATTHLLADGYCLAKQVLDDWAFEINEAEWALPGNLEHDLTLPPIGKSISAEVKRLEDGEYALEARYEIFENPVELMLSNGSIGFLWQSQQDFRPFKSAEPDRSGSFVVSYSNRGFSDPNGENDFLALVNQKPKFESSPGPIIRRSVDPEALLLVLLPFLGVVGAVTAQKLADRISDRFADELLDLYEIIRAGVIGLAKDRIDHFRSVTVVATSRGTPEVEFVAKVNDPTRVISALTQEQLGGAIDRAIDLFESTDARKVQFILNESAEWDFNFLLTGSGKVIGSEASYTRQVTEIELKNLSTRYDA